MTRPEVIVRKPPLSFQTNYRVYFLSAAGVVYTHNDVNIIHWWTQCQNNVYADDCNIEKLPMLVSFKLCHLPILLWMDTQEGSITDPALRQIRCSLPPETTVRTSNLIAVPPLNIHAWRLYYIDAHRFQSHGSSKRTDLNRIDAMLDAREKNTY